MKDVISIWKNFSRGTYPYRTAYWRYCVYVWKSKESYLF